MTKKDINMRLSFPIEVVVSLENIYLENIFFKSIFHIQFFIWRRYKKSGFGKLPWEIIRDIILPITIDRKDTIKLIKKKKEEEKEEEEIIQIILNNDYAYRPCKRARI